MRSIIAGICLSMFNEIKKAPKFQRVEMGSCQLMLQNDPSSFYRATPDRQSSGSRRRLRPENDKS